MNRKFISKSLKEILVYNLILVLVLKINNKIVIAD